MMWPIKHLWQCMNKAEEWHAFVLGFCYPAMRIWRAQFISHYKDQTVCGGKGNENEQT